MSRLSVVGLGPGNRATMTQAAYEALAAADVICGYTTYVELASAIVPHAKTHVTGMGSEVERCAWAVEAATHQNVALVCSGDAGVYGLAGLALELAASRDDVEVEVIPGVTAALAGAAVLGAPLVNDYCTISLSDHLTPWDTIARRLHAAAEAGLVICLYNPSSRQRPDYLRRACDIVLEHQEPCTHCGWVRNIGRAGQEHKLLTLGQLRDESVDMFTTVFIGTPKTIVVGGRLVTPRGYGAEETVAERSRELGLSPKDACQRILLFGGTSEGRLLAQRLCKDGHEVTVSVATRVGAEAIEADCDAKVLIGRRDAAAMARLLADFDLCVDATHPYAQEASANIREACAIAGVALRRVTREASDVLGCTVVTSADEAARLLAATEGPILVTTGTKELGSFSCLDPARLHVRVLPTHEALSACERLGIPHRNIIALQGPFSQLFNETLMRERRISWLVTKDGGRAGGFPEKMAAAQRCGVQTVLIARPERGEAPRGEDA